MRKFVEPTMKNLLRQKLVAGVSVTGLTGLTAAVGALQLLGISILGEYMGKIFEEVKGRPKYVVKSIFNDPRKKKS